jgi:hypothetical protein
MSKWSANARKTRRPIIGESFNPEQNNTFETSLLMAKELEYYRPRGFSKLANELRTLAFQSNDIDAAQSISEAIDEACDLLTTWAQRVARHDYIYFACESDAAGFFIHFDARVSADLDVSDTGEVPKGFSGLVAQVSDHGNVTAYNYSRGRQTRELFAIV